MTTALTIGQCVQTVNWDFQKTTAWGTNIPVAGSFSQSQIFTNGTGAGKAQKLIVDQATIVASGTKTYTLSSYTDPYGTAAQSMSAVHGVFIQNTLPATNPPTGTLSITGNFLSAGGAPDLLTGTTPGIHLLPNNTFLITNNTLAGHPVTASTGDALTLTNNDSTNSAVVNVVIWGE